MSHPAGNLIISRKPGEKILIGEHIEITIVRIGNGAVKLGVTAPKEMGIVRSEIVRKAA